MSQKCQTQKSRLLFDHLVDAAIYFDHLFGAMAAAGTFTFLQ
jgi:hypothetical protein